MKKPMTISRFSTMVSIWNRIKDNIMKTIARKCIIIIKTIFWRSILYIIFYRTNPEIFWCPGKMNSTLESLLKESNKILSEVSNLLKII